MHTLSVLFNFLAFVFLLNTSKKAVLQKRLFEVLVQKNTTIAKILALLLYVCSFYISIQSYGVTAGILYNVCILTFIASLVVVLNPIQNMSYKVALFVFSILLMIEFFI